MAQALKKGLRFNADLRMALATLIATSRTQVNGDEVASLHNEITTNIIEAYWISSELLKDFEGNSNNEMVVQNYTNGEFPVVGVLNVMVDNTRHAIEIDKTPIPFSVYADQTLAYSNLVDSETKSTVDAYIHRATEHKQEYFTIRNRLTTYLKDFTSPAKLLEKAPDFEQFFPESYYDEAAVVEAETSIDDLLSAA